MKMTAFATTRSALLGATVLFPAVAFAEFLGDRPGFSDDNFFTYLEAEIDYTPEDEGALVWDTEAWIGGDYRKLWLLTEGERSDGEIEDASLQLLYGGYLTPFWDWTAGLRHDFEPRSLNYLALGVEGLAPYRFETAASLYLSADGDATAELEFEYPLLLTQRLVAEPFFELAASAQDVPERGLGTGLTEVGVGLRLRYEIRREVSPYLEVAHERLLGDTADISEAAGEAAEESVIRAGLRIWY